MRCLVCINHSGSAIMNRSISIPEWNRLSKEEAAPPVRIQLNGVSMFPLVRMNLDYVTIAPIRDVPEAGDVILFMNGNTGRYVVHRLWKIEGARVLIWGDNCPAPDGWFQMEEVLGKVVLIERGKRTIHPDPKKGLRWASIWHRIRPGYYFAWRIREAISRRIKKVKV